MTAKDLEQVKTWAYRGMPVLFRYHAQEYIQGKRIYKGTLESTPHDVVAPGNLVTIQTGEEIGHFWDWKPDWEHPNMWHPYDPDLHKTFKDFPSVQGCMLFTDGKIECGDLQTIALPHGISSIVAFRFAPKAPKFFSEDEK